jgi:hypothetical protein
MTVALIPIFLATHLTGATIQGSVRLSSSGDLLTGVRVDVDDGTATAWSDSAGSYLLRGVPAGQHWLEFRRLGCAPTTVSVTVPAEGTLHLDVDLLPAPVALSAIAAVPVDASAGVDSGSGGSEGAAEIGLQRFSAAALRNSAISGETDVFRDLAGSPGVDMEEFSTTPHVHGGSGDQNLTLIDGVPYYSPYHATDVLGAVNPDAIARMDVHTAVPPVRYGGRLASVIDFAPLAPDRRGVELQGRAGLTALGQTVDGPLPHHLGGFLVSARRSYRDLFEPGVGDPLLGFEDQLGDLTIDVPGGRLQVLAAQNTNHLAFDGQVNGPAAATPLRNRFLWTSGTQAVVWRQRLGAAQVESRLWHAGANASLTWGISGAPALLRSRFENQGVSTQLSLAGPIGLIQAGLSVEQPRSRYEFGGVPGTDSQPPIAPLRLGSQRTIGAVFVADEWTPTGALALSAGVRAEATAGRPVDAQPRLSLRFAATPAVVFSVGYARTAQYVQSLRNEESILDVIFGAELPVGGGGGAVPIAHAREFTSAVDVGLGSGNRLTLDVFANHQDGLALVAPVTGQPFAIGAPQIGAGSAHGVDAVFEHLGNRVRLHAGYGYQMVSRETGALRYQPSFAARHTLSLGAGIRLTSATTLSLSMLGAAGRRTTPVLDAFEGRGYDPLRGVGDLSGSPQRWMGALDATSLPAYLRLDLTVRHQWHGGWLGRNGHFSGFGAVQNLLGHRNALAVVGAPGGSQILPLLPATLAMGIEWRR